MKPELLECIMEKSIHCGAVPNIRGFFWDRVG
jgi:hypothetical protein